MLAPRIIDKVISAGRHLFIIIELGAIWQVFQQLQARGIDFSVIVRQAKVFFSQAILDFFMSFHSVNVVHKRKVWLRAAHSLSRLTL